MIEKPLLQVRGDAQIADTQNLSLAPINHLVTHRQGRVRHK